MTREQRALRLDRALKMLKTRSVEAVAEYTSLSEGYLLNSARKRKIKVRWASRTKGAVKK